MPPRAAYSVLGLLPPRAAIIFGPALGLVSVLTFVAGSIGYAKSKGWHWAVGLLGLFSFLGLLVIWQLPRMPTRHR